MTTGKRLCANITGEALDWLGGVVRSCFPCFSKPCKYVIAEKQLSRSLVFCFFSKEDSLQKPNKNMESKQKNGGTACLRRKCVFLITLISARDGVFCGLARLVGRGTARGMSGPQQGVASDCRVCEHCFALPWAGVWKQREPARSRQILLKCCEEIRESSDGSGF